MPLAPDQQLFEYRIVRQLGQGGFGAVYLAHDTLLDRPVAIKELVVHRQADEQAFKRFLQEARTAGGLNHPNIVTIYALKVEGPYVYPVMEYVGGGSLRSLLDKQGKLNIEQAVKIAIDVCEGLAAVHAKGIVHRDIKPESILLTEDGRAKVSDFGIAHVPRGEGGTSLTQAGFQPGTLVYMSPEQVLGTPVDARSDVYQLGELLYEMLAGRHYIDLAEIERQAWDSTGNNALRMQARVFELLADAVCIRPPTSLKSLRPDAPGELREIVKMSLSKEPVDRPENAATFAGLLRAWSSEDEKHSQSTGGSKSSPDVIELRKGPDGWVFTSAWKIAVLGRSKSDLESEWQILGDTPGVVVVPFDYSLGIGMEDATDAALAIMSQKLGGFTRDVRCLRLCSWHRMTGKLTDAGLPHLKAFTSLTDLDLAGCGRITDAGLAHLLTLTSLTRLDLAQCYRIGDAGLGYLKKLNLTSLNLSGLFSISNRITDMGLEHLQTLTCLTDLNLLGCKHITDTGLAHLKHLTTLTCLDIAETQTTDAGLAHLSALSGLTDLSLAGCKQISDAGLAHLSAITSLTRLNLAGCEQITDAGLANLKSLTGLTDLVLAGCEQITDVGLAHMRTLTNLTSLNLGHCGQITDAGLEHLKCLINLNHLNLLGCKQITPAGAARLRRPELSIIPWYMMIFE